MDFFVLPACLIALVYNKGYHYISALHYFNKTNTYQLRILCY